MGMTVCAPLHGPVGYGLERCRYFGVSVTWQRVSLRIKAWKLEADTRRSRQPEHNELQPGLKTNKKNGAVVFLRS